MSLMTSGVKIRLWPSTFSCEDTSSAATPVCLLVDDELLLRRLEVVVVVEDLAADELLELRRRPEAVDAELALDQLGVGVGALPRHAVDAERLHGADDAELAVVHPVAGTRSAVAEDEPAAPLHHEGGHRAGVAAHDDRAALLVDAGPRAHRALDDDVSAAERGARQRSGVLLDPHDARHHVLAHRPADPAGDRDLGPVDQADAEVAERALEGDPAPLQDPDADRVLGARVLHGDVGDALLVDQVPDRKSVV